MKKFIKRIGLTVAEICVGIPMLLIYCINVITGLGAVSLASLWMKLMRHKKDKGNYDASVKMFNLWAENYESFAGDCRGF